MDEEQKTENEVVEPVEITPPSPLLQQEGELEPRLETQTPVVENILPSEVPKVETEVSTNGNVTVERKGDTLTITEVIPVVSAQNSDTSNQNFLKKLIEKGRSIIQSRKQKKLEKILLEIRKTKNISNDQVQKLLRVSDATATRYLSELEKIGKVKQVGKTGRGSHYILN